MALLALLGGAGLRRRRCGQLVADLPFAVEGDRPRGGGGGERRAGQSTRQARKRAATAMRLIPDMTPCNPRDRRWLWLCFATLRSSNATRPSTVHSGMPLSSRRLGGARNLVGAEKTRPRPSLRLRARERGGHSRCGAPEVGRRRLGQARCSGSPAGERSSQPCNRGEHPQADRLERRAPGTLHRPSQPRFHDDHVDLAAARGREQPPGAALERGRDQRRLIAA